MSTRFLYCKYSLRLSKGQHFTPLSSHSSNSAFHSQHTFIEHLFSANLILIENLNSDPVYYIIFNANIRTEILLFKSCPESVI